ncbi:glycosyltransferase family 2 protein [Oenococcus sp.]|uniref:glycosyltransferase family 2 protein n=1 Tax=Oenococcus sp. TaxID=1979414 RepID=UPI0039E948D8
MRDLAKVSVITPVYNGAKYLDNFLNLIFHQTYSNFEWIIVDDGSTDNSKQKILDFAKKTAFTNIKYVFQPNAGVSAARNKGLSMADGDFIMFADVDDRPYDDFIEKYLSTVLEQKKDAAIFAINVVETDKIIKKTSGSGLISSTKIVKKILQQSGYGFLFAVIAKRAMWQDIFLNEDIYFLEDEEVLVRMLPQTSQIYCSSEVYYDYVSRDDSVVHNLKIEDYENGLASTRLMKASLLASPFHELIPAANARILGAIIPLIILNWRLGNSGQANHYAKEFVELFPHTEFSSGKEIKRKIQYFIFKYRLKKIASVLYKSIDF